MNGEYFMKKSLQLTLILSVLLFTFSCNGEVLAPVDPSVELDETWQVTSISAYDDDTCSETSIFSYTGSAGVINAPLAADCENLDWFVEQTAGGDATFNANEFCDGTDNLNVSMYLQMSTSDTLDAEAAGNYTHTMYATAENGKNHTKEYSTYGRHLTYGTNMITQILAKVENDVGQANRVVAANSGPQDEKNWTYNSSDDLTMTWLDTVGDNDDGAISCVVITYEPATDYQLRGCTNEISANYFGGDNNEFGLTATEESGNCNYTEAEASEACEKMSHDDVNGDGFYTDDEMLVYPGIIDCGGECQYEGFTGWVGDGYCDGANSNRVHGEYNCEAFNWDGWDCACAPGCVSTYPEGDDGTFRIDGETTSELGDGVCHESCNVEACGFDLFYCNGDISITNQENCIDDYCSDPAITNQVACELVEENTWTGDDYCSDPAIDNQVDCELVEQNTWTILVWTPDCP
jgi:hypothetical protein